MGEGASAEQVSSWKLEAVMDEILADMDFSLFEIENEPGYARKDMLGF